MCMCEGFFPHRVVHAKECNGLYHVAIAMIVVVAAAILLLEMRPEGKLTAVN